MRGGRWLEAATRASVAEASEIEILRERGEDVRIARVAGEEGRSVVVKCWNRRGLRGGIRRATRSNIGWREYEALRRLQAAGTPCPEPLAYLRLPAWARHTEALVSGDLGACRDSTEVYKGLRGADAAGAEAFEEALIASTVSMVHGGLLDTDHRLPNFVVPPGGEPMRIDFELCVPVRMPAWHPQRLGVMLGTFLGSMVFAVQPDMAQAALFSRRLLGELRPGRRVVRTAQGVLDRMMERQRRETGLVSALSLEIP